MTVKKSEKQELIDKLNVLLKKQSIFQQEISNLERRIISLKTEEQDPKVSERPVSVKQNPSKWDKTKKELETTVQKKNLQNIPAEKNSGNQKTVGIGIEKFIGENLINKIGIAVVIIGVAIGVKYAIDNNLISPLIRIILGYLVGFGLSFFAIRLKSEFSNFSAVLFSGAMAIHYFITYAAHTYYHFFPPVIAVILIVIITSITVGLALLYNKQVIAHFGLVGAYIIPYLLKEPFTSVIVLFSYMLIINSGILYISGRKAWKLLNYLALTATWIIFISWFASSNYNDQIDICIIFSGLFFTIFYLIFLFYKLVMKEPFRISDIFFLTINSGVFYFVVYAALGGHETGKELQGLFTFANGLLHFISAWIVFRKKLTDKNLYYWITGFALAFFTFTIPIQFNKNVTVILWSIEAAALFWHARNNRNTLFEYFSYGVIFLALISVVGNWITISYNYNTVEINFLKTPLFNSDFFAAVVTIICFSLIYYISITSENKRDACILSIRIFQGIFPIILMVVVYFTFFTQISLYWYNKQIVVSHELNQIGVWVNEFGDINSDILRFKSLWHINYTLFFTSLLGFGSYKRLYDTKFNLLILFMAIISNLLYLFNSLPLLSDLRESYLNIESATFMPGNMHLAIRYITILFFALFCLSVYKYAVKAVKERAVTNIFEIIFSISVIWICSDELINWLELNGSGELYKHGLSILWGMASMILIIYGIWRKKKHLRITAIALFGVTLIKLFFYDLTNLETVPKTIVFILIGTLLLVVSYLYNKYKKSIFDGNKY